MPFRSGSWDTQCSIARQGRNQAFNSAGNVVAAVSMGLLGYFVSNRSIFFFVWSARSRPSSPCFCIRPDEIDYELARGAKEGDEGGKPVKRTHCSRIGRWSSSSSAP